MQQRGGYTSDPLGMLFLCQSEQNYQGWSGSQAATMQSHHVSSRVVLQVVAVIWAKLQRQENLVVLLTHDQACSTSALGVAAIMHLGYWQCNQTRLVYPSILLLLLLMVDVC